MSKVASTHLHPARPLRNERGFLTLDFIFALTVAISFSLVFFAVAVTLSLVEVGQYVTYAASRSYAGAHESPALQSQLGKQKFDEIMAKPAFKTFLGQSFMAVGTPQFGQFSRDYPEDTSRDNDIFSGARVPIDARLLHLKVPFLGTTATDSGVGKATLNSYLMREVSTTECRDNFNKQRFAKIKNLPGGSYSGGQAEKLITDNGC